MGKCCFKNLTLVLSICMGVTPINAYGNTKTANEFFEELSDNYGNIMGLEVINDLENSGRINKLYQWVKRTILSLDEKTEIYVQENFYRGIGYMLSCYPVYRDDGVPLNAIMNNLLLTIITKPFLPKVKVEELEMHKQEFAILAGRIYIGNQVAWKSLCLSYQELFQIDNIRKKDLAQLSYQVFQLGMNVYQIHQDLDEQK